MPAHIGLLRLSVIVDGFLKVSTVERLELQEVLPPIGMRLSSLLILFIVTVATLAAVAQAQDGPPSYGVVPHLRLTAIQRKVGVVRYSEDRPTTTVELRGTALTPKARGEARIETSSSGIKIATHIRDLTPAENIDPERLTYVMWAVAPTGEASNLGELVLKKQGAALTTSTNLHSFALMITAEPYFAVKVPGELVVLYNVIPDHQNRDTIRADLLPIHPSPKAPLDMFEARNAIRIARLAGAERYAAETFHKALQFLQEAETILASGANRAPVAAEQKSREATQAAEDARSKAVQHQQESTTSP